MIQKREGRIILMIEDDPLQRMMYEVEFKNSFFVFHTAENGMQGIQKVKKIIPDVILLDLLLGDIDGQEVLRVIKKDDATKNICVVVMSNFNRSGLEEECISLGAKEFWTKSMYTPREVRGKVEKLFKSIS